MLATIALTALGGVLLGGFGGFVAAIVQLQSKRLRNAYLVKAGKQPYRDCVLIGWYMPCAVIGALASGALALWLSPAAAITLGSLTAPGLLVILFLAAAVSQMRAPR